MSRLCSQSCRGSHLTQSSSHGKKDFAWCAPIPSWTAPPTPVLLFIYSWHSGVFAAPWCSRHPLPPPWEFALAFFSTGTLFPQIPAWLTPLPPSDLCWNFIFFERAALPTLRGDTDCLLSSPGVLRLTYIYIYIKFSITFCHLSIIYIIWTSLLEYKLHEDWYLCFIYSYILSPQSSAWHKGDMQYIFAEQMNGSPKDGPLPLPISLTRTSAYLFNWESL